MLLSPEITLSYWIQLWCQQRLLLALHTTRGRTRSLPTYFGVARYPSPRRARLHPRTQKPRQSSTPTNQSCLCTSGGGTAKGGGRWRRGRGEVLAVKRVWARGEGDAERWPAPAVGVDKKPSCRRCGTEGG